MFKDIAFGQYYPGQSFIHKMDARIKIVLAVVYLVAIFFIKSFFGIGVVLALLAVMIAFSGVPVKSVFKSVKPILFLLLFTAVLNLFFNNTDKNVLVEWWIFRITERGLVLSVSLAFRLVLIVMGASLLTLTTTPMDLTHGIERLLKPLKVIHFPVSEFALIMSIALRMIPSLIEETDRIIRAQKARGADFESGNIFKRVKAFIPILIPLFIGSFMRATDLANAMNARCYKGSKGRTKMRVLKAGWRDAVGAIVIVVFFAGAICLNLMQARFGWMTWMFF